VDLHTEPAIAFGTQHFVASLRVKFFGPVNIPAFRAPNQTVMRQLFGLIQLAALTAHLPASGTPQHVGSAAIAVHAIFEIQPMRR
jgi:hypothetical protein